VDGQIKDYELYFAHRHIALTTGRVLLMSYFTFMRRKIRNENV
jgi:hypothetical protein